MKAALFDGTPGITLIDTPPPHPGPEDAIVDVLYAGICGSDLYIVSGKNPRIHPPLIPGHEFVGRIAKLARHYEGPLSIGERVTAFVSLHCGACKPCRSGQYQLCRNLKILGCQANGAFAEQVAVPVQNLIPVPNGLSDRAAVLIEPTSIAVHAVRLTPSVHDARTAVIGAGPIGFLVASVARSQGAKPVVVLDVSPYRLANARNAGFLALDAADEQAEANLSDAVGGEIDVLFECAAQNHSIRLFASLGAPRSRLVVVGNYKMETSVDFFRLARNEQSIHTSWLSAREDYDEALRLLQAGTVNTDLVSSHVYPLSRMSEALDCARNTQESMRVVIDATET